MFERFKNNGSAADEPRTRTGSVATGERSRTVDDDGVAGGRVAGDGVGDDRVTTRGGGVGRAAAPPRGARAGAARVAPRAARRGAPAAHTRGEVRARQRDQYGGFN